MGDSHYYRVDRHTPLNPALKVPLWESVQTRFRIWVARFRMWLRKRGIRLRPTFDDIDAVFDSVEAPLHEWIWRGDADIDSQVGKVLDWMDEAVLRAPVNRGLDIQMCSIGLYSMARRQLDYQGVVLDKYNWRKRGRGELAEWLAQALKNRTESEVAITVQTISLGNMMRRYSEMLKS